MMGYFLGERGVSFGGIYKNRIFGQGLHFEGLLNVIDLSLFQLPKSS